MKMRALVLSGSFALIWGLAVAWAGDPPPPILPPAALLPSFPPAGAPPTAVAPSPLAGPFGSLALPCCPPVCGAPDMRRASPDSCLIDPRAAHAPGDTGRVPLQASWDSGLRLESEDNRFSIHVGGLGMIDSVWLIGPQSLFAAPGGGTSGVGNAAATLLRRAILQADGKIFDQFDYMIQFDFANASNENDGLQAASFANLTTSPAPLNVWMQIHDVPFFGIIRAGNQTKPIGMTNNTSAAFLPFMERPDNNDAFYGPFDNGFAMGIAAQNWTESERLTWRYGIFRPATQSFGITLNKLAYGARVTGLPWYEDEGKRLIHVGLGFWGGELVQDELRVRARPLLRNAPGFDVATLVDTSEVPGSRQYTIGPEFALVLGPLTVQAEWAGQWLTDADPNGVPMGTVFYHGGYIEALYFLTGEHSDYDRHEGVFGRVIPNHDLHWKKGDCYRACGAWQIGVRLSYLDLNDKGIQGGSIYDWTIGLNWYWNPNMKVQLNYIAERRDMPGTAVGWINGFGLRAAYDF